MNALRLPHGAGAAYLLAHRAHRAGRPAQAARHARYRSVHRSACRLREWATRASHV